MVTLNEINELEKEEQIENVKTFFSTGTFKDFRLSSILESYETDEFTWINPCNPKFIQFMKLPRTIEYHYNNDPLTTASNKIYQTTSLWWLILACSNYLHQHEIPYNEIILLPPVDQVMTVIKEKVESNVGKTIII